MLAAPVLSATVAAAAALLTTYRAGRPVRVLAGSLAAATVSLLCTVTYRGPSGNAVAYVLLVETGAALVLLARTFRRLPPRAANLAGALLSAAVAVSPLRVALWASPPGPPAETAIVCACWTLLAALASCVGLYLREMDRRRDRSVAAARRAQRLQLSRDLHDSIAHEMTGIVLEAHAGQLGEDPARMSAALKAIVESGARGLDAMERTLRLLREPGTATGAAEVAEFAEAARPPGLVDIATLVERFAEQTAIRVQSRIDGSAGEVADDVGSTAYRIVQEALTNVRRHAANATTVRITVARDNEDLRVSVVDDGDGWRDPPVPPAAPPPRLAGAGIGLTGLAERVRALNGILEAGPAPSSGWAVHAVLPARSAE